MMMLLLEVLHAAVPVCVFRIVSDRRSETLTLSYCDQESEPINCDGTPFSTYGFRLGNSGDDMVWHRLVVTILHVCMLWRSSLNMEVRVNGERERERLMRTGSFRDQYNS